MDAAYATRTERSIAAELGCSGATVWNWLKRHGIAKRGRGSPKGSSKPPAQRAKMAAARRAYWAARSSPEERLAHAVKVSVAKFKHGNANGYLRVYVPGRGTMLAHRYVMEQILGRRLLAREVVHHKDGNKRNNHPGNLELTSPSSHSATHSRERGRTATGRLPRRGEHTVEPSFCSETSRQCSICKEIKPRGCFSPCTSGAKKGGDSHHSWCKPCAAAKALARRHR